MPVRDGCAFNHSTTTHLATPKRKESEDPGEWLRSRTEGTTGVSGGYPYLHLHPRLRYEPAEVKDGPVDWMNQFDVYLDGPTGR